MLTAEEIAATAAEAEKKAEADKLAAEKAKLKSKFSDPHDKHEGKVTLTAEELEAEKDKARKEAREAAKAELENERKRQTEEAERKTAEEQGKYKELLSKAEGNLVASQSEVQRLQMELKRAQVKEQVREVLDRDHKAHIGAEKYIVKEVTFDLKTAPEDITKSIKAAVEQFVKDNPRNAGGGGVPSDGRSGVPRGTEVPRKPNGQTQYAQPGVAGTRF